MPRTTILAGLLLLAACGGSEQADAPNQALPSAVPSAMPNRPGNVQADAKSAPVRCAPALSPQLDRASLVAASSGAKPSDAALKSLERRAGQAFDEAAEALCREGRLDAKLLRPFRTLIIQNGGGATEATFYEDPHEFSSEDLIFQWVFAESGLEVPAPDDIATGLLCWGNPDAPGCADREP